MASKQSREKLGGHLLLRGSSMLVMQYEEIQEQEGDYFCKIPILITQVGKKGINAGYLNIRVTKTEFQGMRYPFVVKEAWIDLDLKSLEYLIHKEDVEKYENVAEYIRRNSCEINFKEKEIKAHI